MPGEIIPISAEISRALEDNNSLYGPQKALDLDYRTFSKVVAQISDDLIWFRLNFNQAHCIKKVTWYNDIGNHIYIWTCDEAGCRKCENGPTGADCTVYTVSVTLGSGELPSKPGCKFGDQVKVLRQATRYDLELHFYELVAGISIVYYFR